MGVARLCRHFHPHLLPVERTRSRNDGCRGARPRVRRDASDRAEIRLRAQRCGGSDRSRRRRRLRLGQARQNATMTRALVLLLAAAALAAGCSARQAYGTLQTSGRSHAACEAEQNADDAARCEADFKKSYDDYERERREVLRQKE